MRTAIVLALLAALAAAHSEPHISSESPEAQEAQAASVAMFQRGVSLHEAEIRADGEVVEAVRPAVERAVGAELTEERALLIKRAVAAGGACCPSDGTFLGCFNFVATFVTGAEKSFVSLVTSSGCSSASSCKDVINGGLATVWNQLKSGVTGIVKNQVSSVMTATGSSRVTSIVNTLKTGVADAATAVNSAKTAISDYFKSWGTFTPWNFGGSVCASPGFWYMLPTDCGLFDEAAAIFTDIGSITTHVNNAINKLSTCVQKKGLFSVPTPFFDLKWSDVCLPSFVTTPLSYFMGALIYTSNAAVNIAVTLLGIFNKLTAYANTLNLMELGREYHSRRTASSTNATGSVTCGGAADWSVTFSASFGLTVQNPAAPTTTLTFSFGMALVLGCKGNAVIAPNFLMSVGLSGSISLGGATDPPKPSVTISTSFGNSYPAFKNRWSASGGLTVSPTVDLTSLGIPASLSEPYSFAYNPSGGGYAAPTGVALGLSAGLGALEESAAVRAREEAVEASDHHVAAALTSKLTALAESDHLDRAVKAVDREATLDTALKLHQHGPKIIERSASARKASPAEVSLLQTGGPPVDLGVGPYVGFTFCVTPVTCFGQ
jgi:hypothetical protein